MHYQFKNANMFVGKGKIHYDDNDGFRVTVEIGQDLADYYRSLIPPYRNAMKSRWPAHITVVRPEKEIPPKIRHWGDYEGEDVEFLYDPHVMEGNGYFWINAWCKRLEVLREELGLPIHSKYTLPPTGFTKCFHMTVGKYVEVFDLGDGTTYINHERYRQLSNLPASNEKYGSDSVGGES